MEIVQAQLEGDGAALLAHLLVGLVLDLLDDLLDARRMDTAVGDQTSRSPSSRSRADTGRSLTG